ncbi:DUF1854 domain-containing protein [Kiritimatiellaeota bacterium B1221]|nr:DUF1854 domain-containing protein [Kiritimatiellaeota bacterium B1221]
MSKPTLLHLPNGQLALQTDDGPEAVTLSPCFPWTAPGKFLSLRNAEGKELCFLESPDELDEASRCLLNKELSQSTATFQIESIQSVKKEIELRCWEVTTSRGTRSFQTELDEWPRALPDGSFLIEDLFGDLYVISALEKLDPLSAKLFWPLIG